ncbi:MAG TPA: haloacid dehalogenase-like hydrolase [Streptosporangiaceae bacterium]|nr:haloacid dehalogenase-like hydrolase [Streptosporangiaceae bacterium]
MAESFPHRRPVPAGVRDAEALIHRLVLWNIDLTLVDVTRVSREAYAEAFRTVTGRPLVRLPQMAGRSESEIFFEALALNGVDVSDRGLSEKLLAPFGSELATALAARRDRLRRDGHALPGAAEALTAAGKLDGVIQTVLTGTSKPNALLKLRTFGLEQFFDFAVGGYGSEPYPKGALVRVARLRAAEKYHVTLGEHACVYIADSVRDVEAARMGGAASAAVASGRSTAAELRAAGADAVLADLTDPGAVVTEIERLTTPSP